MRRAAKVDTNQAAIVAGLRAVGATVHSTAALGRGFPDLAVGFRGVTYLLEVKQPKKAGDLTPDERAFILAWRGHVAVVTTLDEALEALGFTG